jgi:type IV secretory pathway TraG/TraD family ATPase VirD4
MMSGVDRWGPSHQTGRRGGGFSGKWTVWVIVGLAVLGIANGATKGQSPLAIAGGLVILAAIAAVGLPAPVQRLLLAPFRSRASQPASVVVGDPLAAVRGDARRAGGGVYLGLTASGQPRHARPERAVLLLGPPRSGKTSAVIIPAVLAHTGPVVSTSTKPDVARATQRARGQNGRAWVFDPTGTSPAGGPLELRWSPVRSSTSWDGALLMARAMTSNIGAGTTDRSHWSSRAQALLAPMLHAAAVHGRDMETVVDWVMRHELDEPGILLEDKRCSRLAFGNLLGLLHTEDRERSSIFSSAADALQAYGSEHALAAAKDPNFDTAVFVRSMDTVYVHAPAEAQAAAAPIVCSLLAEIRRASYKAHSAGELRGRVLFALDEVANIAPLEELPQIASEGGGQGLLLLAALQDLSQARARWGAQADGFLTLFGTKLILPGIADPKTLETVSTTLGEYDRQVVSRTRTPAHTGWSPWQNSTTVSTQRTRVLSAGEVANIPAGRALHLDGVRWELLTLTPAHATEPWRTLTTISAR